MLLKSVGRFLSGHNTMNIVRRDGPQRKLRHIQCLARHFQNGNESLPSGIPAIEGSLRDSEAYERFVCFFLLLHYELYPAF